jgi:hypothetical protein
VAPPLLPGEEPHRFPGPSRSAVTVFARATNGKNGLVRRSENLVRTLADHDSIRRTAARVRRTLRLPGGSPIALPNGEHPDPLPEFRLFAVLGTWMEADIVDACVRNAIEQGCEEVFLVDNDSPDDTVAIARRAGATLAASFSTPLYNEWMRIGIMNQVVQEISLRSGESHIWWLWLDADEFPRGPRGLTIREYLATLDRRFRVVGARFAVHVPSSVPAYTPGADPLACMPWYVASEADHCDNGLAHAKHPLQRFDRGAPPVEAGIGFHSVHARLTALLEPRESIDVHHFQYREEVTTRARLTKLCGAEDGADARASYVDHRMHTLRGRSVGVMKRFEDLDRIYARAQAGPSTFPAVFRRWDDL